MKKLIKPSARFAKYLSMILTIVVYIVLSNFGAKKATAVAGFSWTIVSNPGCPNGGWEGVCTGIFGNCSTGGSTGCCYYCSDTDFQQILKNYVEFLTSLNTVFSLRNGIASFWHCQKDVCFMVFPNNKILSILLSLIYFLQVKFTID